MHIEHEPEEEAEADANAFLDAECAEEDAGDEVEGGRDHSCVDDGSWGEFQTWRRRQLRHEKAGHSAVDKRATTLPRL
jgi:hypothetical protein